MSNFVNGDPRYNNAGTSEFGDIVVANSGPNGRPDNGGEYVQRHGPVYGSALLVFIFVGVILAIGLLCSIVGIFWN